jgi:hypothetical protein
MLRPQNADVPLDRHFHVGLGWMLSTLGRHTIQGGGVVAHHAGATRLFRSQIYILPAHKLGVVVLANSSAAQQLVDHVATEALALELEAKTGIRQPEPQQVPTADRPETDAELAQAGGWFTTLAGPVHIHPNGRRLQAEVDGHTLNMTRRADGLYSLNYALLGLIPIQLGVLSEIGLQVLPIDGHEALVARLGAQEMLVGDKLLPSPPLGAWRQRLGRYEIVNLGDDLPLLKRIELQEDHGHLVLAMTTADGQTDTARGIVWPVSDAQATLLGVLRDGGEAIQVVTVNGEERLQISGYQARRVGP